MLFAAREQMAISLGFHIVLACFGLAFPALIYVAHRRGIRGEGDPVALGLARRWSKVAAVLFAIGAVSGTVLSFEMGMLWPGLMGRYGDVIGLPFALEGIAFFLEAIFIGVYLYGWDRLPGRTHLLTLVPILVSGTVGTFCIVSVNGWMNAPTGFRLDPITGNPTNVRPIAAMFNRAALLEFAHLWLGAFMLVGFLVASVYAWGLRRGRDDAHHRLGFKIAIGFAAGAALIQPISGHLAGQRLTHQQPAKLAAMELADHTETHAPLVIGGLRIGGRVRYGLRIPGVSSFLATNHFDGKVIGLNDVPVSEQPPVNLVHITFQSMVGIGSLLAMFALWYWWIRRRGRDLLLAPRFLKAAVVAGPAAVVALELGWVTTEVGRQPWVVDRLLTVRQAVTTGHSPLYTLPAIVVLYAALSVGAVVILRSMARRWRDGAELDLPTPYGPPARVGEATTT